MPSQYHESEIIRDFFGDRIGRFCDAGAHDGRINSNTYELAESGWSGMCVEPSPLVFPYLMENMKPFPFVQCLNAAIDRECKIVQFHDNGGDQMGTTEQSHRDIWTARGSTYSGTFWLQTVTWQQLLAAFPGPYPFISIDTEGSNLRVLKECPLRFAGCELVCVEKEIGNEMPDYLRSIGYGKLRETAGNWLASQA